VVDRTDDLDTPTTMHFASTGMKVKVWVSLTGHELIIQARKTQVEGASGEGNT
jgi:hypothetical protein